MVCPVNGVYPVARGEVIIGHSVGAGVPNKDGIVEVLLKCLIRIDRPAGGRIAIRCSALSAPERGEWVSDFKEALQIQRKDQAADGQPGNQRGEKGLQRRMTPLFSFGSLRYGFGQKEHDLIRIPGDYS